MIYTHTFSNGIRIAHKYVNHTKVAHCGFVLDIGSRDEQPHQQGIAHFWEHMAFKGTKKRKAYHIINRLEAVGGELNAETSKEKVAFYASFLDKHYEKALELLADVTFEATFPPHQLEKERKVILEEMSMYLDSPDEAIQDEFDALVFENHPLGNNILGTRESIQSFQREDFIAFFRENLDTQKIVFTSVGNIPFDKVLKMATKYLAHIPAQSRQNQRLPFTHYTPKQKQKEVPTLQAHCVIGLPSYSFQAKERLPFALLTNFLGGASLNSRLNMALREKHGYVYSVEANYQAFFDTGLFSISFATDKKYLEKSLAIIWKELQNLTQKTLTSWQMHHIKEQLLGQLAMSEESNLNFMLMMGKSLIDYDYIEPIEEIFKQIEKIQASDLQEVAQEIFQLDRFSMFQYLPKEQD
ncbi:MAG: insulinase family protein [Microscillaceae bacterium]|nr:insulinase family protein [Microscillaceae bacterium]MDW8460379.1 pitrilysin family protein [Cytophagales bacterium]